MVIPLAWIYFKDVLACVYRDFFLHSLLTEVCIGKKKKTRNTIADQKYDKNEVNLYICLYEI